MIGVAAAAALVVAIARLIARDRDVFVAPRPVAFRVRRAEDRDGRDSDCRGDMKRTGVARQHDPGAPGNRHEIADRRLRRGSGDRACRGGDRVRELALAGAPENNRPQTVPLAEQPGDGRERRRRPALVGPCGAGIDQRVLIKAGRKQCRCRCRFGLAQTGIRAGRSSTPSAPASARFFSMTCRPVSASTRSE